MFTEENIVLFCVLVLFASIYMHGYEYELFFLQTLPPTVIWLSFIQSKWGRKLLLTRFCVISYKTIQLSMAPFFLFYVQSLVLPSKSNEAVGTFVAYIFLQLLLNTKTLFITLQGNFCTCLYMLRIQVSFYAKSMLVCECVFHVYSFSI